MTEKNLTNKKHGMLMLLLFLLLFAAAIAAIILGAVKGGTLWLLIPGIVVLCIIWVPMMGLKVLKPQEALVLTLFGKYIGTLKGEGYYYVNPFCSAVNPAAKTKLSQSGDVKTSGGDGSTALDSSDTTGKKLSFENHDPEQQPPEDQRLPGQSGGDRHCRYLAYRGYRQGGL